MGVERFFSSINRDFNITIDTEYPYNKIKCKYLMIDFNSVVHVISQHMINTINRCIENNEKCIFNYESVDIFETDLLLNINKYIQDLLTKNIEQNILEHLYIAIDGVPTMAKMYEQKKRRYMGSIISNLSTKTKRPFSWSKNNISPGTNFMKRLQNSLHSKDFDKMVKKICINIKKIKISDTTFPGEGEMKIINHIKKNKINNKDNICVYSPDSDMMILLLILDNNFTILRYDQQKSILDDNFNGKIYNILNVDNFKKVFIEYIQNRVNNYNLNERKIINDVIFILTVFGDDFLPKLESLRVSSDLFLLLDYYIINIINSGYLIEKNKKIYNLRIHSFYNFMNLLSVNELLFLKRNSKQHIYSNYFRIEEQIVSSKLYLFRDYLHEYIWKFIYINRNKKISNVTINNINVNKHINLKYFIRFIDGNEPSIDNHILKDYANKKFYNMDKILIKELKKIFMENYLEIIRIINIEELYNHVIDNNLIYNRKRLIKNFNKLYYLIDDKENLFMDFITYMYVNNSLPINIQLYREHPSLQKVEFNSNKKPHSFRLNKLDKYEQLQYMIDFKLDEYTHILNPKDKFYYEYFIDTKQNKKFPERDEIKKYYKIHFNKISKKDIVKEYLLGLNWVVNYYFNGIINKTWYYPHSKSPLMFDIIDNFNKKILLLRREDKYTDETFFTPFEQLIFISPLKLDENIKDQLYILNKIISNDDLDKLVEFIKSNKKYFFKLNEIVKEMLNGKQNIIDCSNSIFISKCHLIFLEKEININNYLKDFRKIFPLKYQRKYYPLNKRE
jgi:5'-3' exonuclease